MQAGFFRSIATTAGRTKISQTAYIKSACRVPHRAGEVCETLILHKSLIDDLKPSFMIESFFDKPSFLCVGKPRESCLFCQDIKGRHWKASMSIKNLKCSLTGKIFNYFIYQIKPALGAKLQPLLFFGEILAYPTCAGQADGLSGVTQLIFVDTGEIVITWYKKCS